MKKGSKEGEKVKSIVAKGDLVPFELTCEILINALIATPS
jgi:adenylate kinase family enzyme